MCDLINFAKQFENETETCCFRFILHFFETLDGIPLDIKTTKEQDIIIEEARRTKHYRSWIEFMESQFDIYPFPSGYYPLSIMLFEDNNIKDAHMGIFLGNDLLIHATRKGVKIHKFSLLRKFCTSVAEFKFGIRHAKLH